MKRTIGKLTLCSVALLSMAFIFGGCGKEAEKAVIPTVKTQMIAVAGDQSGVSYAGEIRGRYESQLSFQVGGRISARNVELGTQVHTGDLLMQLDPKDVAENVNIGAAQVASAKAQLDLAATNLQRYRELYEQQAVSAAQYDQYQTNYAATLAAYQQAQAQYAQSGNALGYTTLTADGDGVISAIQAETGQVVAAGQSVITLVKTDELEAEINIPENRLKLMPVGKAVQVKLWALEGTIPGVVREVSPMADPVARTYKVRITLLNAPADMRLGMTANVEDKTGNAGEAMVLIPLAAVYQTGDKPQVWILEGETVHLRTIEIAAFGDNQVKVTRGLTPGEVIVTAGVHKLMEGQQVQPMERDAK